MLILIGITLLGISCVAVGTHDCYEKIAGSVPLIVIGVCLLAIALGGYLWSVR